MSVVCKLVRDGSDLVDFQDGSSSFQLANNGWRPQVATLRDGVAHPVIETLRVRAEGSSHDNLAVQLQDLANAQYWADVYRYHPTIEEPVWFHAKMDNETGTRRALVRSIEWAWESTYFGPEANEDQALLTITIERAPFWEDTAGLDLPSDTPTAGVSVLYDYTNSGASHIEGDVPARIRMLQVDAHSGDNLGRLWMGFRTDDWYEDASDFEPVWELEAGTTDTDAAKAQDATASDETTETPTDYQKITVSSTATFDSWSEAVYVKVGDITTEQSEQYGLMLWLLRYKVASGTWYVQLRYGYEGVDDADLVEGPVLELTSTSWDLIEAGQYRVPGRDLQAFDRGGTFNENRDSPWAVHVFCKRANDSAGELYLDCLCPIPLDEGWLTATFDDVDDTHCFLVAQAPTGRIDAQVYDKASETFEAIPELAYDLVGLPVSDKTNAADDDSTGYIVIAYARAASSDITDQIDINDRNFTDLETYARWISLRGAE